MWGGDLSFDMLISFRAIKKGEKQQLLSDFRLCWLSVSFTGFFASIFPCQHTYLRAGKNIKEF